MPGSSYDETPRFAAQDDLDLRQLMRGIGARKWRIIVPTLAAMGLTFAAVNLVKPRYTSEAKLLLENQESFYTRPEKEQRDQQQTLDPEAVQSQVQLVTSRDVARQVAQKLDLMKNAEFDPLLKGVDPFTRVLILLGLQKDPASMSPEERVLETYFNKLTVYPVVKTRVLTVEFTANSPELAADSANAIAEAYLSAQEDAKRRGAKSAAGWLLATVEDLRVKVQQKESEVADFRAKSGLLMGTNATVITSQQLGELNSQLASARAALAEAQAKSQRLTELLRQGRVFEVSDVVKDDLVRRIGEQRVTLKSQLALEARTLLPGHPRIKELQAQLADVDAEMRRASEKIGRALEGDAKVAAARVRSIETTLDAQKKVAAAGDGEDVRLRALEREAKSARDQLESYLAKYREASARDVANASTADARIISRAVAPQLPSFPKKLPMLLISGLGALVLSAGLVVARLLLSGGVIAPARQPARREKPVAPPASAAKPLQTAAPKPQQDLVQKCAPNNRADRMAALPAAAKAAGSAGGRRTLADSAETLVAAKLAAAAPETSVAAVPAGLAASAAPKPSQTAAARQNTPEGAAPAATPMAALVRVVRGFLDERGPDALGFCVLVTGPRRATGSTGSAVSLARALALEARAVIVDLDLATPGLDALVADTEGPDAPDGLTDLITGRAAFSDALHRDADTMLHVLPAGCDAMPPGDHSEEIGRIVGALRRTYDFVVLDAASPAAQDQTLRFAELARCIVLVSPKPEEFADEIVALLQKLPSGEGCESLIFTPPGLGRRNVETAA